MCSGRHSSTHIIPAAPPPTTMTSKTEAGSEVVVWNTAHMRGREGIEVSARTALVFTVENGQVTCLRLFDEQDEALEAVGLSE